MTSKRQETLPSNLNSQLLLEKQKIWQHKAYILAGAKCQLPVTSLSWCCFSYILPTSLSDHLPGL